MATEAGYRFIHQDARIYVAGHRGLVGSAIEGILQAQGYHNILTRTRAELDLLDSRAVEDYLLNEIS